MKGKKKNPAGVVREGFLEPEMFELRYLMLEDRVRIFGANKDVSE